MTRHYCDICGKLLDESTSYSLIYSYICHVDQFLEQRSGRKQVDLCEKCFKTFEDTINKEKELYKNDTERNT